MRNSEPKKTACSWGAKQAARMAYLVSADCRSTARSRQGRGLGHTLLQASGKPCCKPVCRATMHPALKGAGAEHTMKPAVATPTDKRGFVMSRSQADRGVPTSCCHGCGQDEPIRKDGCMTGFMCSTSCPPYALEQAAGGFLTQPGA